MSIATVFDGVKIVQRERLDTRTNTFERLTLQVADDAKLDPDEVADQLDQLDRTAEELATAAQLIVDRRGWAAQLVKDAELLAEHNRLYAEEQAANAELAETIRKAKAAHAARVGPIQQRLVNIVRERDVGQTARNKLVQTSPLRQRLAKIDAERASFVIALQGPLGVALRHALPGIARGNCEAEIARTQAKADQLAVEIARLEQEALLP